MRHFAIALASLCMLLVVSQTTKAGTIYDLQNYPADQNGHTLSGTITTDGTIGTLQESNIKSWNVTIDATDNFSSHDPGAVTSVAGLGLAATATELSFATSLSTNTYFVIATNTSGGPLSELLWNRTLSHVDTEYVAWFMSPPQTSDQRSGQLSTRRWEARIRGY